MGLAVAAHETSRTVCCCLRGSAYVLYEIEQAGWLLLGYKDCMRPTWGVATVLQEMCMSV